MAELLELILPAPHEAPWVNRPCSGAPISTWWRCTAAPDPSYPVLLPPCSPFTGLSPASSFEGSPSSSCFLSPFSDISSSESLELLSLSQYLFFDDPNDATFLSYPPPPTTPSQPHVGWSHAKSLGLQFSEANPTLTAKFSRRQQWFLCACPSHCCRLCLDTIKRGRARIGPKSQWEWYIFET